MNTKPESEQKVNGETNNSAITDKNPSKTGIPDAKSQNNPQEETKTDPVKKKVVVEEEEKDVPDEQRVRLAVVGNVDSGKSTLVGVLTKGIFDNGRGSVRKVVFNYGHEAEKGQTSSIGHEIMGFNSEGVQQLPDRFIENKNKYWAEVTKKSSKIVVLLDLCGHKKYLKTTIFGLSGLVPDYSMIIVGANTGEIARMTQEHLGITLALKIPFFVVVTKIDMAPENVLQQTIDKLEEVLRSQRVRRIPTRVKTKEDLITCAENLPNNRICPIFLISSVTGEGVDLLKNFIFLLQNRNETNKMLKKPSDPVEFAINENFLVAGVGIAVSGTVMAGTIKLNSVLLLGPDKSNAFRTVQVKGIHKERVSVDKTVAGEMACLAIKPTNKKEILTRDDFRKGMVLIDASLKTEPVWEFEADVIILHHATQVQAGYQAVVHCGVIRQSVKVQSLSKDILRAGERGLIRFKYLCNAEYMKTGSYILFREGEIRIFGVVTRLFNPKEDKANGASTKSKPDGQAKAMQISKPQNAEATKPDANGGTMKISKGK